MALFGNIWRKLVTDFRKLDSNKLQDQNDDSTLNDSLKFSLKRILKLNAESTSLLQSIHAKKSQSIIACDPSELPSRKSLLKRLSRFVN